MSILAKMNMDLNDLPVELREYIAEYLTLEDIVVCSKACPLFDRAFNLDSIWKRFSTYNHQYFEYQDKMVHTSHNSDMFDYMCTTKESFYNEMHIKRNLENGEYHVSKIECGMLYCDNVFDAVDSVGNHWLFISCMKGYTTPFQQEHNFQVWSHNEKPNLHVSVPSPIGVVNRLLDTFMFLKKGMFFYVANNIVLIYEFCYPTYNFRVVQHLLLDVGNTFFTSSAIILDNLLFRFSYESSSSNVTDHPSYHVWNNAGSLVKHETFPITEPLDMLGCPIQLQIKSNDIDTIIIVSVFKNREAINYQRIVYRTMHVFYVPSLTYSILPMEKFHIISFNVYKNIIGFLYRESSEIVRCCIYYLKKGNVDYDSCFEVQPDSWCLEFIPGRKEVVIMLEQSITVFDIVLKKEISSIEIRGNRLECKVLSDNLILIHDKNRVTHEVWNFRICKRLYDIRLSLPPAIDYSQIYYTLSFIQECSVPPKIVAYKDPQYTYPREIKTNNIYIFSFW